MGREALPRRMTRRAREFMDSVEEQGNALLADPPPNLVPLLTTWSVIFVALAGILAIFNLGRAVRDPTRARAHYAIAVLCVLLCVLILGILTLTRRKLRQIQKGRGQRNDARQAAAASPEPATKKVCANCDTAFLNQHPPGVRQYACARCGLVSRKPKVVRVEPAGSTGEAEGRARDTAGAALTGADDPAGTTRAVRGARSEAAAAEGIARKATARAEKEARRRREREEAREREAAEELERLEIQRLIEEERERKEVHRKKLEEEAEKVRSAEEEQKRARAEAQKAREDAAAAAKAAAAAAAAAKATSAKAASTASTAAVKPTPIVKPKETPAPNPIPKTPKEPTKEGSGSQIPQPRITPVPLPTGAKNIPAMKPKLPPPRAVPAPKPVPAPVVPNGGSNLTGGKPEDGKTILPIEDDPPLPPMKPMQPASAWGKKTTGGSTAGGAAVPLLIPPLGASARSATPPPPLTAPPLGAAVGESASRGFSAMGSQNWLGMGAGIVNLLGVGHDGHHQRQTLNPPPPPGPPPGMPGYASGGGGSQAAPHVSPPLPRGPPPRSARVSSGGGSGSQSAGQPPLPPMPHPHALASKASVPSAGSVRAWLASLSLDGYAQNFERERISMAEIHLLTDADLERLGLPLGPRRRIAAARTPSYSGGGGGVGGGVSAPGLYGQSSSGIMGGSVSWGGGEFGGGLHGGLFGGGVFSSGAGGGVGTGVGSEVGGSAEEEQNFDLDVMGLTGALNLDDDDDADNMLGNGGGDGGGEGEGEVTEAEEARADISQEIEANLRMDLDNLFETGEDGEVEATAPTAPATPPETPKLPSQQALTNISSDTATAEGAATDPSDAAAAPTQADAIAKSDQTAKGKAPAPPSEMMVAAVQLLRRAAASGHQIPQEFYDCITCEVMVDPVIAWDGHTYERTPIARWLAEHSTSPMTGETLPDFTLRPNHSMRSQIINYGEKLQKEGFD